MTVYVGELSELRPGSSGGGGSVLSTDISDSTVVGRDVLTAGTKASARTAIGAGTSSFSGAYADLTGAPSLATVATSGSYADLSSKPTLATVATSGAYSDLSGKPSLATVATSGSYNDLTSRPTLGTASAQNTSYFATSAQGTLADNAQPKVGVPSAFTSRTLTNSDDGDTLVCGSSQTATVNTGLLSGFGCVFKGTIGFSGTATVTDERTSGSTYPWCALIQTATDTYSVVGGKA